MQNFSHVFEGITDPRHSNATRHDLHEMLMIALLTVLSGGETCTDMAQFGRERKAFLRRFMTLKHGIPSHDAFSDLFNCLNPRELGRTLTRLSVDWSDRLKARLPEEVDDVIALDGKALRHSFADATDRQPLHLVHAFATGTKVVLAQARVDGKSSEITAIPALLELLDVKGRTVTLDAMHAQRETARSITDAGGSYICALKGNQKTLYEDVKLFLDDPDQASSIKVSDPDVDTGHGRIETRTASVCHDIDWLDVHDWPALAAIGSVTAQREIRGKQSMETRYFIMNRKLTPEQLLRQVRSHWAIENSLHWVLDVTMNEDYLRKRTGPGPENLAVMRRLALNLARLAVDKRTPSIRGRLEKAGWNHNYALKLISLAGLLPENGAVQKR